MGVSTIVFTALKWALSCIYSTAVLITLFIRWVSFSLNFWKVKERQTPPKCLSDPSFTHKYLAVNGVKLHCVCAGDDNKKLMLFMHGFPEFWYSWRHQMKHFSRDYWVVAVDMRGYGDSEKPSRVSDYTQEKLRKDLLGLPAALGRKKIDVLVGHDWGGVICWDFVEKHKHLVDLHIAINIPHPGAFQKVMKSGFKQFKKSWYIFMFQMPYVAEIFLRCKDLQALDTMIRGKNKEWSNVTDEDIEAFKYTYSKSGAWTPPLNYYRAVDFTVIPQYKKITVPTLLIWGNDDLALCEEGAHYSEEFVEDFTLKIVEGAPHFITNTHPAQVNHYMKEWLSHRK